MPLYNRRPEPLPAPAPAPRGLTALLGYVRQALAQQLAEAYWVVAEVAEITLPRFANAHCYFTLTEQTIDARGTPVKAQARATLWSQRYQQLAPAFERQTGQPLRAGLKLLAPWIERQASHSPPARADSLQPACATPMAWPGRAASSGRL